MKCYRDGMRPWWAVPILVGGCGPVMPASDRVPMSGGAATTDDEPHTKPGSSAPHDDGGEEVSDDDDGFVKLDVVDSGGDGIGCAGMVDVVPLPSAVELLVDVSQSMATKYIDHDGDPGTPTITRWNMLADALAEHLPALADGTDVGLQIFPAADAPAPESEGACAAAVGPAGGASVDDLLGALPPANATFMLGATPTASAFASANWRLQLIEDERPRFIVVLTDGAPNCNSAATPPALFEEADDGARAWAEYAYGMDITTYVVAVAVQPGFFGGGPEGDAYADHLVVLQTVASFGGTALLVADDAAALDGALTLLGRATASCRARVPDDLLGTWFNARVDGLDYTEIPIDQCPLYDGFAFVENGESDTIQLCGQGCADFRATGTATLIENCSAEDIAE